MTLGERIKMLRQKAEMTQEELAKAIGYSTKTSISKIENDVLDINQSTIVALARVLHTTPSVIMGWEDESDINVTMPATANAPLSYPLTPRENILLTNYRKLNSDEQQKADDYVENLVKVSEGSKPNIIQKPIAAFGGAETLTVDSDVLKAAIDAALKEKGLI